MASRDCDLKNVRTDFGLQLDEQPDLFTEVSPVPPRATLAHALAKTAPLASAINPPQARAALLLPPYSSTSGGTRRPSSVCLPV
jgi:hypothetical protein